MQIRWLRSLSASSFYAAAQLAEGRPFVNDSLAAALAPAAKQLCDAFAAHGVPPTAMFAHLIPLAGQIENNRELARTTLSKTIPAAAVAQAVDGVARALVAVELGFEAALPDAARELELREQPLRMQWEARGPGLTYTLRRLTSAEFLVETATVALVHPVVGGGGGSHWPYNTVTIEAVLTDAQPRLPEIVRLAWLLAQLNLDLAQFADRLTRAQLERSGSLAVLGLTLYAAQEVELTTCDEKALALAVSLWTSEQRGTEVGATLRAWLETYLDSRPELPIAIAALDEMLEAL